MTPYRQLILDHDPAAGRWGDCYRTAIGCLLDMPPERVPHFCDGGATTGEIKQAVGKWLAASGYAMVLIAFRAPLEDLLDTMEVHNQNLHYLLSGYSVRRVAHVVVARGGRIVCDPVTGLPPIDPKDALAAPAEEDIWWCEFIVPLGMAL